MPELKQPIILGIAEDRAAQMPIAQAFNDQGVHYRFVTDPRKVTGGVKQLRPQLLLVFGELGSDFVIHVLDALSTDVRAARRPVVVICEDVSAGAFVQGMRTGVVGLLPAPFTLSHIGVVKALYEEVSTRTGHSTGTADSATLKAFVDHIRRTRRSGVLVTNARTSDEARASFTLGRLDRATFLGAIGQSALNAMLAQPQVRWSFTEVAGAHSEGAGVVIEVGTQGAGEVPLVAVTVGDDEPLAFEVPPEQPPAAVVEAAHAQPQLLLVDDDAAILKMFSGLFRKHGCMVTTATDGKEGLEAALQRPFDAVVADLNMPYLDGWGMLHSLREDFRTRELPIAFLSAHDDYRDSLKAVGAGAQAYLSKGTKLDIIVSQVMKLLEPRRTMSAMFDRGETQALDIHTVGPQWLVRLLVQRQLTGVLQCKDGWASYQLGFEDGLCIHASAVAGKYTAEAERAFNAFIASRSGEGSFLAGPISLQRNLFLATEALVERACNTLNDNERRMREALMVSATHVEVNNELYAVYRSVGPQQWLEAARLICEEKTTPRDVIAQLNVSPLEVEECLKDLIRRGVMKLQKA